MKSSNHEEPPPRTHSGQWSRRQVLQLGALAGAAAACGACVWALPRLLGILDPESRRKFLNLLETPLGSLEPLDARWLDTRTFHMLREIGLELPYQAKWLHGANRAEEMRQLASQVNLVEADIVTLRDGRVVVDHDPIPLVMQIKLHEWASILIDIVASEATVFPIGAKLDFKDPQAFYDSIDLIYELSEHVPVIVNADVVNAYGETRGFSVADMINIYKDIPTVILSFGWRTGVPGYTPAMIETMRELLGDFDGDVTFAVRASSLKSDYDLLKPLIEEPGRTLTLWGRVTRSDIAWIVDYADLRKTFLDVRL